MDAGSRDTGLHVVVAGGGFAALEAILALRAFAGNDIRVTLISPRPALSYRPAATIEAFADGPPQAYDLQAIADDLNVTYLRARLEAVAPAQKWVRLDSGARLTYDSLILAIGARAQIGVAGALTFRDQRDVPLFRGLLEDLNAACFRRFAFALPSGVSWPLPLYELALLSAARIAERDIETEVAVVTPERRPLEMFGEDASRLAAELLHDRGVRFVGRSTPTGVLRDRYLQLAFEAPMKFDRVVAVPQLRGQRITGVPASWWGFVPTDTVGRVQGLADVFAVGDMTTFPIKQGGLAAQQADRAAHVIADQAGFSVRELRTKSVVQLRLVGGVKPLFLRTELDEFGQPGAATFDQGEGRDAPGAAKVFGRYLTPYLEGVTPRPLAA
jgi:sulfide:quinone oxidoreductase